MARRAHQGIWIKAPYHYETEPKALIALDVAQKLLSRAALAKATSWIVRSKNLASTSAFKLDRTWCLFLNKEDVWFVQTPRLGASPRHILTIRQRLSSDLRVMTISQPLPWPDTDEGRRLDRAMRTTDPAFAQCYLGVHPKSFRVRKAR